jgi:hypothetical protein
MSPAATQATRGAACVVRRRRFGEAAGLAEAACELADAQHIVDIRNIGLLAAI